MTNDELAKKIAALVKEAHDGGLSWPEIENKLIDALNLLAEKDED